MSKVKEKTYRVRFEDVGGIAYEGSKPTESELREALTQECKNKIEMMGLDEWLEHSFTNIREID